MRKARVKPCKMAQELAPIDQAKQMSGIDQIDKEWPDSAAWLVIPPYYVTNFSLTAKDSYNESKGLIIFFKFQFRIINN